jgi:hypothetical protein
MGIKELSLSEMVRTRMGKGSKTAPKILFYGSEIEPEKDHQVELDMNMMKRSSNICRIANGSYRSAELIAKVKRATRSSLLSYASSRTYCETISRLTT